MKNFRRFIKDIKYDLLVPPLGLDFYNMTSNQAKENFEWFISVIPERTMYLKTRCANDLKIDIDVLDFSADSLIPIWRWFIKIARMEKTPKEELEQMKKAAEVLGESFINREKFTIASQFIMRDIGMYVGQAFVLNYHGLHWHYYTKPKNEISAKQPVIAGFRVKIMDKEGDACFNPIGAAEGCSANFYDKTQAEIDLYNIFMKWVEFVPRN